VRMAILYLLMVGATEGSKHPALADKPEPPPKETAHASD
jgi:hypothetical protein